MKNIPLEKAENIKIHGRFSPRAPYTVFWSGAGIEMNVKCNEIQLNLYCNYSAFEPWITIEVNGAVISRIRLSKGGNNVTLLRGANKNKVNNIRVLRDSQPFYGKDDVLTFLSISADDDAEFLPIENAKYRFEFVGDSITSGEGLIGARSDYDFVTAFISNYQTYERTIAREMNADIQVVSQCGWGLVSGWDNNPDCSVSAHYNEVCSIVGRFNTVGDLGFEQNDFSLFVPDAVIINLATNDNTAFNMKAFTDSSGNTFKQDKENPAHIERFKKAVYGFLFNLREKRENALIVWSIGAVECPFISDMIESTIKKFILDTGDDKVVFLPLTKMNGDEFGSRSHPGLQAHRRMADEIEAVLKERL